MAPVSASTFAPQARLTYLGVSAIIRRQLSTSRHRLDSGSYTRSDFSNQGYTGYYEPREPTEGPLKDASNIGTPRITPTILKQHLDQFVVGQERAKKTLATAVYNHYQRIQELQRRDEEEEEHVAQEERRRMSQHPRHPVEDEFPGQQQTTINLGPPNDSQYPRPLQHNGLGPPPPLHDPSHLSIEKSNVLLLGPSGVGKTLMAKTLARVLEVPFSISDCTPFTQAGYIGEDADVCVQRLLAAANYDVTRAERGIICLDEIDKIATARVSHGKDVSGEGVQQALLKIIEGTTLQIQAKQERGSGAGTDRNQGRGAGYPTNSPLSGGNINQQSPAQKGEVYNVRTDNILFICAGAFNGLHKMVLDRISKGSIGFGATVRAAPDSEGSGNHHETILEGGDDLFEKHLPYYMPPAQPEATATASGKKKPKRTFNTLDLVEPQDIQKYGLIPELVGRIPLSCALSSLDVPALVKVLTEPRNSLLKQYQQLFSLSSIELRFTTPALYAIATTASKMGTGARGLRTVMERLLADAMYETPGSGIRYVLINEDVAERKAGAVYFARGQQLQFRDMIAAEEDAWEERKRREEGEENDFEARARVNSEGGAARTFEEYREKATAAGFV
ncbi:ATP-dependent clpX-like chaperone, mitochondrial [Fulvia fulva]|uniref:ATP-dependent clpX-like chaperone, mitochondrial n=1 Tax=Passalora fulva TaxID=5499 RepID=A0A9Q8LAL8_PASFU|nr:ATP-dependent clpX-like chaperone, mitochondrial [Fulvia fulva]KAK4631562.1 ATP-dependent clpX-like chaperone, mitochondrial [Fulvia fulva]KAK4633817.1 ATP-dependent clpX-like chaperone, mitochondrial [Fulvia fulva]UJO13857.1 ATP-dependent clpX-like chaperone, mitochondrial [Fulvia fulva]WPV10964.1 ATP-dependent clpX-like chaperone, mitochondrial [Fulvia fulva]WPV26304.1 ATP-dependent clpX-like chaperone, mitochondrial [Fulvia fulva]